MKDQAADIAALRQRSNDAIAARDADLVVSFMARDITVAVAAGPVLRGRDANREAFASQMAERGFGGYVRTPDEVTVDASGVRATERGRWTGTWHVAGRAHVQRGRYTAEWRCGALGWEIVQESYEG